MSDLGLGLELALDQRVHTELIASAPPPIGGDRIVGEAVGEDILGEGVGEQIEPEDT